MKGHFILYLLFMIVVSVHGQNKCFNSSPHTIVINTSHLALPSNQITVECWIKAGSLDQWSSPLSFISDNQHKESGFAFAYIENKLRFMLKTAEMRGDEWNYNPGIEIETNQWIHVAATYDGESIKIYSNGELTDSKTTSGSINWDYKPTVLNIGAFHDFNENVLFDGQIDEVRIWNKARSSKEIYEFKNKALNGGEENLIAYYDFDQSNNQIIKDLSKSNLHGKLSIPMQEQMITPSGAMTVPKITKLEINSPSSFNLAWETSESVFTYDYYNIEISKDKSFKQLIADRKSITPGIEMKDITGGSNIYIRIKAYSKDIGFTAYSEIMAVSDFSTALSVLVTSETSMQNSTKHKLVDYNVLMTDYIGFPIKTKDLKFNFKLNNIVPENITSGSVSILGPQREYHADFSQSSDVSLFDLKPGKYDIIAKWGAAGSNTPLSINLKMEIKPSFYQQSYIQIIFALFIIACLHFAFRTFKFVRIKELQKIKEQIPEKANTSDWISPKLLEEKAIFIKDYVVQEKPYLDPKFNLKLLAEKIDIPHYQTSRILKDYFDLNFNDFINEFRVKEFVRILNEDNAKQLKNSAIAYNCGFYSESTFFRAFKKFMGKTPQQYQKGLAELVS